MNFRLYIDEVGNSNLGSSNDPNHRYLSLTGIILNFDYVLTTVFPAIEGLKRDYFGSHPDEPVILHRKELVNKKYPFESLREPSTELSFNESLLNLLLNLDYAVLTVVIDKLEHKQLYQVQQFDPYHYCLTIMVERFVLWLKGRNVRGDVMAESRGGEEDRRLKTVFEKAYIEGSDFVEARIFASYLTSRQLKVKPKDKNIAGLQLADLIAHPSFRATLARKQQLLLPENFGGKIGKILEDNKYVRSPDGDIDGWGRKWLP